MPPGRSRATVSGTASGSRSTGPTGSPSTAATIARSSATTTRTRSWGAMRAASASCSAPGKGRSASVAPGAAAAGGSTRAPSTASRSSPARVVLRRSAGGRVAVCGDEGKAGSGVKIAGIGRYRGSVVARATGGNILVINQVSSEGYVKGVVPNEVPSSWPMAALEAQAVVARSYGLATSRDGPFDQYADTRSQVYGGRGSETKRTNSAVAATAKRDRHLPRRPGDHLLLLHVRGPDRELGIRLLRRQPGPVPEVRRRPVRRRIAGAQLDRAPL